MIRLSNMVLTRAELMILLDDLEKRRAVRRMVLQKTKPKGLWDDEPIHCVIDSHVANPEESISHYFPTTFWMTKL